MSLARRPSNPLVTFGFLLFLLPALTYSLAGPLHQTLKEGLLLLRDAAVAALPGETLLRSVADRFESAWRPKPTGGATWAQPGTERRLSALAFPGWSAAMRRHSELERAAAGVCDAADDELCRLLPWRRFLDGLRDLPPLDQVRRVNRHINKLRYRTDQALWGKSDYWAAPDEFLAKGGDCEDFAIAKYYSLKRLGFAPERMRIVVLNDRKREVKHAVLALRLDGREILLDSLHDRTVTWAQVRHYEPIYSVNEERSWLHADLAKSALHGNDG